MVPRPRALQSPRPFRWALALARPRALAVAAGVAALALLAGCSTPPGVIFPPDPAPLGWPAAPEKPRVLYVGQIATDADLQPGRSGLQNLGRTLFGKNDVRSMLTPFALCTDDADRLFVADSNAQVVHVFNLKTRAYAQWRPDPPAAAASSARAPGANGAHPPKAGPPPGFDCPVGLAWDPLGRLYVADSVRGVIQVFDAAGVPLTTLGQGLLRRPAGIAFDRAAGRLLVADVAAHRLLVFGRDGALQGKIGQRGSAPGEFNFPTHVAVDGRGHIFVSDALNFRVQEFDPRLAFVRIYGKQGDVPGSFSHPKGLAFDSEDHLYVVDAQFEAVQVFGNDGALLLNFGEEGRGRGQFWLPAGIHIDAKDRVWIADSYNRRVQVFDYLRKAAR